MSISKQLESTSSLSLIIPCAGKMFKSSISKNNKALCFCINKGYIESDNLESLYYLIESINQTNPDWLYLVGGMDKVHIKANIYCYRQRVFFYSFINMCEFCKRNGIKVQVAQTFKITIDNILSCMTDLRYLEWYAKSFDESIDSYLTNTCKVQIFNLLQSKNMTTHLRYEVDSILCNKSAYLERAPFLVGTYDSKKHTSSVFINKNIRDSRMYSTEALNNLELFGFTEKMIEKDEKAEVFTA